MTPPTSQSADQRAPQRSAAVDLGLIFAGFLALWLVLDRLAAGLGSLRGEHGVVVCLTVVALAVIVEAALFRTKPPEALSVLGLRAPRMDALAWTALFCVALLAFFPLYALVSGQAIARRPDALLLSIGIFAQGGIAEELVFRGFLFRRLREGRTFWKAAALAAIPFIAIHMLLFFTMDPMMAAAALIVSLSMSFPLAWLFERSGDSIWPCAAVHAVVQGAIKLIEVDDAAFASLALAWMAIATIAPWLFFLLSGREARR